ncbi:DNA ligase 1-like isoform X2 [Dreissena polymorpha]|nr:DNA ligase 1-like isoform X2 [Dreissena polymorpha]
MSKKRIRRIIAGDDPTTISSSGTDDETTDEENKHAGEEIEEGEFAEKERTIEGDMTGTLEGDMEGGDMEGESELEEQVADSTSLYTHDTSQSERGDWEESNAEDGSVTGTNHSPAFSDDYQEVDHHNKNEEYTTETKESATEGSDFVETPKLKKDEYKHKDTLPIQTRTSAKPKKKAIVRDPNEEPEEGEVFDDDDEEEEEGEDGKKEMKKCETHHTAEHGEDQTNLVTKVELIKDEPVEDSDVNIDVVKVPDEDGKSTFSIPQRNELKGTVLIEGLTVKEQVPNSIVGTIPSNETESQRIFDQKLDIKTESNIETVEQTFSRDVSNEGQETARSDTRNVKVKAIDNHAASSQTTCLDQKRVVVVKDCFNEQKLKAEQSFEAAEDIIRMTADDSEGIIIVESDNEKSESSECENSASKEKDGSENPDVDAIDNGSGEEPDRSKVKSIAGASESSSQTRRVVKPPSREIAPALTRNQMELLELEMRARAIKAMLKKATLK